MGLLRASLVFVVGYFTLNILTEEHTKKLNDIPIFGPTIEPQIQKLLKENKATLLLLVLVLVEFIL
jgi:hypothetical protein|tara:strand:- start:1783 stop:1980 length:198 start_codon:yes stop_codon:yes gene_type:complete